MQGKEESPADAVSENILRRYPLGDIRSAHRIPTGLIHRTWRVAASTGDYILQRLHPDLASDAILADYQAVTEHLAESAFPSPRLVMASDGRPAVDAPDGRYRLITCLDGQSYETVESPRMAEEAARMLGGFHVAMNEFRYRFTGGRPLHDSPKHLDWFRAAVSKHPAHPLMEKAKPHVDFVERHLPRYLLPEPLPSRVVHGDPKISNILFQLATKTATGMVDLDSCSRHTALVDIGDAVRSWCRTGLEDEPTPFLPDRFAAVCEGYRRSGAALSAVEKSLIVQACLLIPLELASRFLRDVFEDRYFGWDPARFATRPAHNLARAGGCVALFESMLAQRGAMEKMVSEILDPRPGGA